MDVFLNNKYPLKRFQKGVLRLYQILDCDIGEFRFEDYPELEDFRICGQFVDDDGNVSEQLTRPVTKIVIRGKEVDVYVGTVPVKVESYCKEFVDGALAYTLLKTKAALS